MKNTLFKVIIGGTLLCFLAGCVPGPPLPPLLGPGIGPFLGWIFAGAVVVGAWVIFKKSTPPPRPKDDYLTNALNDINERLKRMEEKIEKIEKNDKS